MNARELEHIRAMDETRKRVIKLDQGMFSVKCMLNLEYNFTMEITKNYYIANYNNVKILCKIKKSTDFMNNVIYPDYDAWVDNKNIGCSNDPSDILKLITKELLKED